MSGIYIPGISMPTNCCQCPVNMEVCKRGYEYLLEHPELYDKRADDCPIVPVPDHGDLIDKSGVAVLSWTDGEYGTDFADGVLFVLDKLDELPVVIPAEGEDYVTEEGEYTIYESIKAGLEQAINGEYREETVTKEADE